MQLFIPRVVAVTAAIVLGLIQSAFAAEASSAEFNIQRGDATATLGKFADQSGVQIVYFVDDVRGVATRPVKGTHTPFEALATMLDGTPLRPVYDESTGALTVQRAGATAPTSEPETQMNKKKTQSMLRGILGALLFSGAPKAVAQDDTTAPDDEILLLSPFEVNAALDQGYRSEQANTGTIIAVDRNQIPFQTSVITSDLIDDLEIDNPADLSQVVSGVSKNINPYVADEAGAGVLSFMVRGFSSTPLYNGFQTGGRVLSADNIGRVEVSKGPNSVLYGQSPGGGVINIIPKMPRFDDGFANLIAGFGSQAWYRGSFEMGGPVKVGEDSKLGDMAFRIGGGYLDFEREQVFFRSKNYTLNGALSWNPVKRVQFNIQAEYIDFESTPSRTAAFVTLGSGTDRVVDEYNRLRNDRNFSYNGPYSRNGRTTALTTAYLTTELTETLTLRVGGFASVQEADTNGIMDAFSLATNESATVSYTINDSTDKTFAYKVDLLHKATLYGFTISSLLGYEDHYEDGSYIQLKTDPNNTPLVVTIPFSRRTQVSDWPAPPPRNTYTRLISDGGSDLNWSNLRFTQFYETPNSRGSFMWGVAYGDGETTAYNYINDTESTNTGDDVTYTVGTSWNVYNNDDATLNRVIVFANYATSFQIQGGNAQDPEQFQGFSSVEALQEYIDNLPANTIDPQTGSGYEAGVRFELLQNKLALSVAYFDQSRENIARTFLVRESNVPGVTSETVMAYYQLASGEENSKGIDLALNWQPIKNLSLTAEAMISDGKVVSNSESPEEEGFGLVRSPENIWFLWGKYDFTSGFLDGFSVGLGASYASSTRVQPNLNDRYRVSDDYIVARALVSYRYQAFGAQHAINLNVENLLDEQYVDEANFLSEPRLFRVSYSVNW